MRLDFYYVDILYAEYLRNIDNKIPLLDYEGNTKFLCGIVLEINEYQYYAPISHNTTRQKTNMLIYDSGRPISSIKFSFMFPVKRESLQRINIEEIALSDPNYANLLRTEYRYCLAHEEQIRRKAASVYQIGCNPHHRLNYVCCDFRRLEEYSSMYYDCSSSE